MLAQGSVVAASLEKGSVLGRGEGRLVSSISISILINLVELTFSRLRHFRPSFAVSSGQNEKSLLSCSGRSGGGRGSCFWESQAQQGWGREFLFAGVRWPGLGMPASWNEPGGAGQITGKFAPSLFLIHLLDLT